MYTGSIVIKVIRGGGKPRGTPIERGTKKTRKERKTGTFEGSRKKVRDLLQGIGLKGRQRK